MDWTEITARVPTDKTDEASAIANMTVPYGIYIEDYTNLEADAEEIAHIDLIDEELVNKDRTHSIIHMYIAESDNAIEAVSYLRERFTACGIENEIKCELVDDTDWNENWKKYFPNQKPTRLKSHEKHTSEWGSMSFEECAAEFPTYLKRLDEAFENRIKQIAERYKGRIDSWDVVNESAEDDRTDRIQENLPIAKSRYGIMNGDYPYKALKWAEKHFPSEVKLNINDYQLTDGYKKQIARLIERGCKIDIAGLQMHLFNPQSCVDIANGANIQTPQGVRKMIDNFKELKLPLHLSEITITSPSADDKGYMIQAIITQNLYRLWFSMEYMMGITWWNVVDNCGAKGEPSTSGLFFRNMQEKPVYHALNNLINNEWTTRLTAKTDKEGKVEFRGFKGKYRITWTDKDGREQSMEYNLE